jgi:hypothetical protein
LLFPGRIKVLDLVAAWLSVVVVYFLAAPLVLRLGIGGALVASSSVIDNGVPPAREGRGKRLIPVIRDEPFLCRNPGCRLQFETA